MKSWIEGLSRLEDAERDMDELAHHGADDDHGYLAGGRCTKYFSRRSVPVAKKKRTT